MKKYLTFDIGGTNLKYALVDENGQILEKDRIKTNAEDLDAFMESMYQVADKYQDAFSGIAVCAPGKIDTENKIIYFGGALPFLDGLNLQETLGQKYGVPISVENDGKTAALSEQWLGELRGVDAGVAITLGTGVGGGIIVNNRILHGWTFQAGELSWMITNSGIGVKNMAAYTGVSCSAVNMIKKVNLATGNKDLDDGLSAFEAINNGDLRAMAIFKRYCRNVAIMIINIQTVINASKFVIGGGISNQKILIDEIDNQLHKILDNNPMIGKQMIVPVVVSAKHGNDSNLYGALYSLLRKLNK
ncbi:ROK family protein [Lactobacillus acidophilus ATCC 4796]|uniref:ROK family protein n=1 Tax=Lactobacillus acidophilus TaxID=1579 RepID=UPI00019F61BA|nr:ROK family protein [Lactobacillus acidophilus]EEJ76528.1 ROK family protein [Lactobacillus acidophilus ATCC 4796]MCT3608670.1 ROK family protein [Lactobacillus acidophilus]